MDLLKHISFFNPTKLKGNEIHIIGVGAVGSNIALTLVKLGVEKIYLWDFDKVEPHNITNQVYDYNDLGKLKTEALKEHLLRNNPNATIVTKSKYNMQPIKGIIFLTVDSMELRKNILENLQFNPLINLIIDGRIGLEKGQVIATDWKDNEAIENHLNMSDFKDNDTDAPISACGTTLSVAPSVIITAQYAVAQFINYVNYKRIKHQTIQFDAFEFITIK